MSSELRKDLVFALIAHGEPVADIPAAVNKLESCIRNIEPHSDERPAPVVEKTPAEETPAPKAQKGKAKGKPKKVEETPEELLEEEEEEDAPKNGPAAEEEEDIPEEPKVDLDALKAAVKDAVVKNRDQAVGILADYGASKVSEINPKDYAAVIEDLKGVA